MRKFPKVAFTHYFDGIVKSNRFNPQGALQSFTRRIELDASNTDAHKRAGLIWLDRKHYTVARTHFDQMLKYDSSNVYAYKYRAIVNTSEENFPHAIDDYSRAD